MGSFDDLIWRGSPLLAHCDAGRQGYGNLQFFMGLPEVEGGQRDKVLYRKTAGREPVPSIVKLSAETWTDLAAT